MADKNIAECLTDDVNLSPSDLMANLTSTMAGVLPGAAVPFDPAFPQVDGIIAASSNYELKLPAGITFPSIPKPEATNILGFLQPLLSVISSFLMILGPIKIIIDVIIAIINLMCCFPNPAKMAQALVALILSMVGLAALFPIAAALVLLIQVLKTVIMILSAILLIIVPKIELIIKNAQTILQLSGNNDAAKEGAVNKICSTVQDILNDLGILSPINAIISLIALFSELGTVDFCTSSSGSCCDDCPKINRNPPQGRLDFTSTSPDGLSFIVDILDATYSANIEGASALADVGSVIPLFRSFEQSTPFLPFVVSSPSTEEPLGSYVWDILQMNSKGAFKILINKHLSGSSVSTTSGDKRAVVSYSDSHGLVVGHKIYLSWQSGYSGNATGFGKVVEVRNATTIVVEMDDEQTSTVTVAADHLSTYGIYDISLLEKNSDKIKMTLKLLPGASPPSGTSINYRVIVDKNKLPDVELKCFPEVQIAKTAYDASVGEVPGNDNVPASPYTDSLQKLLGVDITTLKLDNIDALKDAVQARINDPHRSPDDIVALIQADSDKMSRLLERALCVTVSAPNSIFTTSSEALDISLGKSVTLSFQPRSIGPNGGEPLMAGMPPTIDVRGIFTTTHGTISDIVFDSQTGTYTAQLTADSTGVAEIRAFFLTTDVCSSPAENIPSSGFPPKILQVRFIKGNLRPRNRQYMPSAGGRRR